MLKNYLFMAIIMLSISFGCSSQEGNREVDKTNRQPYAAGRFYTDNPGQLRSELQSLFKKAGKREYENVIAVISPHASYAYSGEVAASSIGQIDSQKHYDNIFVIASSHRVAFSGASVYYQGDYITPLGTVEVNHTLAKLLVDDHKIFTFRKDAHAFEHSLEVQLPLLQYQLQDSFRIVPIVIGAQNINDCKQIADALKPYFNLNNLFIISTDFSHYPSYNDAVEVDKKTAGAILTNSVKALSDVIELNKKARIPDLATSLCGWSSVFTLLYMTQDDPGVQYHELKYMNSGDQVFGDKNSVVGYYSIVATQETQKSSEGSFQLDEKDKQDLLHIARGTIELYIQEKKIMTINPEDYSPALNQHCGAFVTLEIDGQLRGCIGRFNPEAPLCEVVRDMAISSSTQDYRFPQVETKELNQIEIEISVLTPMKKIETIDEIELGKHGIYIKKGYASGTFLPQVAHQTGWSIEDFLGHCARDKARIGWNGWKDADVYIYEAIVFKEGGFE